MTVRWRSISKRHTRIGVGSDGGPSPHLFCVVTRQDRLSGQTVLISEDPEMSAVRIPRHTPT